MASTQSSTGRASKPSAFAGESAASLSSQLPRSRRGYDLAATDLLLARLVAVNAELEQTCNRLRNEIAGLEGEAERVRTQKELVGKTLLAATSFAMKTREGARREAELTLRNAGAKAVQDRAALVHLAKEREDAERQLLRLQQLTQEMQSGLAGFLRSTLHELRPESEPNADAADSSPPPAASVEETLVNALEAALQPENR